MNAQDIAFAKMAHLSSKKQEGSDVIKRIIKEAFNSGLDQGLHEIKEPNFESFYIMARRLYGIWFLV